MKRTAEAREWRPAPGLSVPAPCAVCGGAGFEILDRQSLLLVGLGRCDLAFGLCQACGHIQQSLQVAPKTMERYYASFSNYTAFEDARRLRAAPPNLCTQRLLAMARDLGLKGGRAYEVGCASGKHLHHFGKAGWRVGGCDLSPKAALQAKAIYGIDVAAGAEEEALPAERDLDLLLIVHVLEHLYNPAETLRRACAALAPEGRLVIEVPCATAPELQPPGWFAFEHLHYFSAETLSALLARTGFEVLELRITLTEVLGPVIVAAARQRPPGAPAPDSGYALGTAAMARRYVALDRAAWDRSAARLGALSGPVFLWGAGVHTAQLLDRTGLAERLSILAVADRDPQKWGLRLGAIPVISPDELLARPSEAPIIVSSYFAEGEIVRALKAAGVPERRIVALYGRP